MSNRLDATNCTHEAALARVAELESKLGERSAQLVEALRVNNEQSIRLDRVRNLFSKCYGFNPMVKPELKDVCGLPSPKRESAEFFSFLIDSADRGEWMAVYQDIKYGVVEKQTSDPFVESAKQRCSHCGNYVPCGCWPTV